MSDSGQFPALAIQPPDMTGEMLKINQLHKYSLDVAKQAQEYNSLKKYGEGAMRDDPEAKIMLGSKHPAALSTIESLKGTAVQTATAKQKLATQYLSESAQELSVVSDPAQQASMFHQKLDFGVKQGFVSQAEADMMKWNASNNPNFIPGIIYRALQPQQTPFVAGQHAGAVSQGGYPARSQEAAEAASREPPITIYYEVPNPDYGPNDSRKTIKVPRQVPRTQVPGAIPPGSGIPGYSGNPYMPVPMGVPGIPAGPAGGAGVPPATRGMGPRSDLRNELSAPPGGPRATLASYSAPDEESYGSENEYGAGPPSLSQKAYMGKLFGQESGHQDVKNRMGSSASGLGQFIDDTWEKQMQKLIPEQVANMSRQQVLALRSNSRLQEAATISLADDNAPVLAKAGLPVNAATLAMSHKLGVAGAIKVLKASPNTSMVSILGGPDTEATRQNPTWAKQSAAGFVNSHYNAFGSKPLAGVGGELPTGAAPTAMPPAMAVTASNRTVPPAERSGPTAAAAPAAAAPAAPVAAAAIPLDETAATPAAEMGTPAARAAAWTPGMPNTGAFTYGGGDSIGLGFIKAGGVPGTIASSTTAEGSEGADGVGSRNPQQALDFITAHPDRFEGQDVLWSTGLSNSGGAKNAEKNLSLVDQQITEMKKAGANNIVIAGVGEGSQYGHLNERLDAIAKEHGVSFAGALPTSGIHLPNEKAYKDYVQNAARNLEMKRSDVAPQDTVENPPTPGIAPASELTRVADTASGKPPDELIREKPPAPPPAPAGSYGDSHPYLPGSPMPTEAEKKLGEQILTHPGQLEQQKKLNEATLEAQMNALKHTQAIKEQESGEKDWETVRDETRGAVSGLKNLETLSNLLDDGLITGPMGPVRADIYAAVDELTSLLNIDAPWAKQKAAMLRVFDTVAKELGFNMVTALGSREAMQVVQQVMSIKPSMSHPSETNRLIIASLKAAMQMQVDKRNFYLDYNEHKKTKNDFSGYHGADREFEKKNPIEAYASTVVPYKMRPGMDEKDFKKHVIYDMSSGYGDKAPFKFGKWDGDSFDKVDEKTIPVFGAERAR